MKTITVGELRQNPTRMLDEVEAGESYRITRHGREIGRIVPPSATVALLPAKTTQPSRLAARAPIELTTATSVDELLADMTSDW